MHLSIDIEQKCNQTTFDFLNGINYKLYLLLFYIILLEKNSFISLGWVVEACVSLWLLFLSVCVCI